MGSTHFQGMRTVVSRPITAADANSTAQVIDVPAGTYIPPYGVRVLIKTAFAGGTPSSTVGDGAAADGWLASSDITETSAGAYASAAGAYAVAGKYYAEADTIDIVVAAGMTAGLAYVIVDMLDVSELPTS